VADTEGVCEAELLQAVRAAQSARRSAR
jgi:hypothetical protein